MTRKAALVAGIAAAFILAACEKPKSKVASRHDGEALARANCASCHAFPEPELLDRETWTQSTLPSMGNYFGIFSHEGEHGKYRIAREQDLRDSAETRARIGMIDEPRISTDAWEAILTYYAENAPEKLPSPALKTPEKANFRARAMKHPALAGKRPVTTAVTILEPAGMIAFASADSPEVRFADRNLTLRAARDVGGTAVDLQADKRGKLTVTVIGELKPSEKKSGKVVRFSPGSNSPKTLASNLHRPVRSLAGDFNGDGREDLVVCEFGHHTGQLSWLESQADGSFQKHLILAKTNAIAVVADGLDLFVLFAGGREGIWKFKNDGSGNFIGEELLTFPASTGSVALAIADLDGDGHQDLLHLAGDNDDSSPILKPYHGLRIFTGSESGKFSPGYFHAMPGAYDLETADFDLDGDLDIALCAQFGDHEGAPDHSFIILENEGGLSFSTKTHPATSAIRWAGMDAGDLDHDGDIDLVLGAMIPRGRDWLSPSAATLAKWRDAPEVLLLENLQN